VDKLVTVVAPVGVDGVLEVRESEGPAPAHSPITMKATMLSPGATVEHTFPAPPKGEESRKGYVHVIQTSGYKTGVAQGHRVKINGGLELAEGDGSFAWGQTGDKIEIENIGSGIAEVLVFDIE